MAGLLTGGDFLNASSQVRGNFVIIPRVTLKNDEPVMLDGMTLEELRQQFTVPVYALDFASFAHLIVTGQKPDHQGGLPR